MANLYRVYLIRNSRGTSYVGVTENVAARIAQHNAGESRWTKGKGPWQLAWTSEELSLSHAGRLENRLKRQKGGDGFFRLTGLQRPEVS